MAIIMHLCASRNPSTRFLTTRCLDNLRSNCFLITCAVVQEAPHLAQRREEKGNLCSQSELPLVDENKVLAGEYKHESSTSTWMPPPSMNV